VKAAARGARIVTRTGTLARGNEGFKQAIGGVRRAVRAQRTTV